MIKTTTVGTGVRDLVVVRCLVVVGITDITAQFLPSDAGPVFTQLPAVNPLTEMGEMVVRATPPTLQLARAALLVGAILLAVGTPGAQMVEGGAEVALISPAERIPGIVPVGFTVGAVLHHVISLTAFLTPPPFSWYRGAAATLGFH